jgi:hypothetical protein
LRNPGGISDRPLIDGLILVVRRLDSFTERLCAGFRDEGFQVINAPDGARGLKTFQELHPTAAAWSPGNTPMRTRVATEATSHRRIAAPSA